MRRIIEGRAYNTDTAAQVASAAATDPKAPFRRATLFLNRDGRYFVHYERTDLLAGTGKGSDADEVIRLIQTPEDLAELRKQMGEYPWLIHDEAAWKSIGDAVAKPVGKRRKGAPVASETALTLRLPQSLKARVASAAAAEGVSANAWIMRQIERGLSEAGR